MQSVESLRGPIAASFADLLEPEYPRFSAAEMDRRR